jgi:hypothetical protein
MLHEPSAPPSPRQQQPQGPQVSLPQLLPFELTVLEVALGEVRA